MKRAVICTKNPWNYIDALDDHSLMIINPDSPPSRLEYLLAKSDWSLLISDSGEKHRNGADYGNERLFWYTSGTTGDSKFYGFTRSQLDRQVQIVIDAYEITANDRYVGIMPLWHAHGQLFYWITKKVDCETHFLSGHDIKNMHMYDPTFITAIPDFLKVVGRQSFNALRFIRSASSALPDNLFHDLQEKYQVPVLESFGMTETLSHCFTNPLHGEQRIGTVGLPSGVEAQIREDGLWVRGPAVFTDQWFDTGDLASVDSAGYYKILGRKTDRLNIRGYKIDPVSVESQLRLAVPDLGECVIFGQDRVNCIFTGPAAADQVSKALIAIHPYCAPASLVRLDEIPKSPSGKISRSWLAQTQTKNKN